MTGILRKRVRSNFTVLPNKSIRDEGLSFRAVGVLTHMLSLKDGSPISAEELSKAHTEGRDAVQAALRELTRAGYYKTVRRQAERGRWVTEVQVASERGVFLDDPVTEGGFSGLGEGGSPTAGSQGSVELSTLVDRGLENRGSVDQGSRSSSTREKEQPLAPAPQRRAEVRDAVLAVCGLTDATPTAGESGGWNRAVKDLMQVGATPDDVRRRAAAYRARWPRVSITPSALARHWSECASIAPDASSTTDDLPEESDPLARAAALGRNRARTDITEEEAMATRPRGIEEAAIFRDAFLDERARLAGSSA